MPPKPKFTKEEVAKVAFEIVKEGGLSSLTAREVGRRLGTSASPIFTYYSTMDEVKAAAREIALREFKEYVSDYKEYTPAFKRIGMMIVSYGMKQPELFKLLFMQEHEQAHDIQSTVSDLGDVAQVCMQLIRKDYGMSEKEAQIVFEQMWVHAFGLGVMCAMGVCNFSEEEIGKRLGIMFASLAMLIKSGKVEQVYATAEKNTDGMFQGRKVGDLPYVIEPDQESDTQP